MRNPIANGLLPRSRRRIAALGVAGLLASLFFFCAPSFSQELINYSTPPYDSAPAGAAKINTNTLALWEMFGPSGVLCGHGGVGNPMTACTYANIVALFSGCNAGDPFLSYNGTCQAGGGGGSGNVSVSGTPVSGQIAQWVGPTAIQGISATGAGSAVLSTSPTITTPTIVNGSATSLNVTGTLTTNVTGSSQCVQVNSSGVISGTGAACGGSSSGTVGAGTTNQVPYYAASGTTLTAATLGNNLAISGGVLGGTQLINAQTGTTYTVATTDAGKLITLSNSSSIAVSLPAATTTGYTAGFSFDVQNVGIGAATITPATSTINGVASISLAANAGCTITSDGTNYQVSACTALSSGGTSGSYNTLTLCTYPGVDPTGATDSLAAVTAAVNAYANTNTIIQVACPIFLHIGSDGTKPIYLLSGTHIAFSGSGHFIVDNVGVNAFVVVNSTNGSWDCSAGLPCIVYNANAGALMAACGPNCGVYASGVTSEFAAMSTYLTNNFSNSFQSGTGPAWFGQAPFLPIFNIRGATSGWTFNNLYVTTPSGASAANFVPIVVGFWSEYNAGVAVSSGNGNTTVSSAYMTIPTDVEFYRPVFDNFDMGFVGIPGVRIIDPVFKHYSDMQDGTNGANIVFSALGASSGTLSSSTYPSGWVLPTGIYGLTLSTAQVVCMTLTHGLLTATTFISCSTGSTTTVTGSPTLTATAGNMGGYANWFAPPHAIYVYDQGYTGFPYQAIIHGGLDEGLPVSLTTRRSSGSGSLLSLKWEPANGSTIDGYTSLRPDGCVDFEPNQGQGSGSFRNVTCIYNSSTPTSNSGVIWDMRFTGTAVYSDFTGSNIDLIDLNTEPAAWPVSGPMFNAASHDNSFTGVHVFMPDWCSACTFTPGYRIVGNREKLQSDIFYTAMNSTQGFRGVVDNASSDALTNSDIDVTVYGWRSFTTSTYNANIARIVMNNSVSSNNRAIVHDASNSWIAEATDGGLTKESWTQCYQGTGLSGASIDTGFSFPTWYGFDAPAGWAVTTTVTGATSVNIGWSGSTSALLSGGNVSTTNTFVPPIASVTSPGTDILLTPVGGSFTGGNATACVHGVSYGGTH